MDTALLDLRLPADHPVAGKPSAPAAISPTCAAQAVVQIEPLQHCILIELRCRLDTLADPPAVLVAPDPVITLRFLRAEEDPWEAHYTPMWVV